MRRAQFALLAVVVGAVATVTPAGGSTEQTPTRGGTASTSRVRRRRSKRASIRSPVPIVRRSMPFLSQVLEGAFETGPDLAQRPNLVSGFTVAKKPFTLTYRIRPEARWSDGCPVTARRLPVHPQAIAHSPSRPERRLPRTFAASGRSARRRSGSSCAPVRPLARAVPDRLAAACPRGTRPDEGVARPGRQPEDRRADRQRALPRRALERGKQLTLVRNPRYWGPHTAYLDRIVVPLPGDDALGHAPPRRFRRGELGVALHCPPGIVAQVRRTYPAGASSRLRCWLEHFDFRVAPAGIPP